MSEQRTPDELEALAASAPGTFIQTHPKSDTAFLDLAGRRYWAQVDEHQPVPEPPWGRWSQRDLDRHADGAAADDWHGRER